MLRRSDMMPPANGMPMTLEFTYTTQDIAEAVKAQATFLTQQAKFARKSRRPWLGWVVFVCLGSVLVFLTSARHAGAPQHDGAGKPGKPGTGNNYFNVA